jgi:large subunit ribosomal protein L15
MKLHDLHPAPGSRTRRTRVGRGIAAGGGKTAGRGTKGQKARAGGSIPPWFEGGQTPLHQRIPKLRGFRNPFKIEFEVVNLGRIAALVELGAFEPGEQPGAGKTGATKTGSSTSAPITVNQEILRAVGLVRTLDKPLKILGQGEVDRPLFVVADAFSRSAVTKIEAAGGTVSVLEVPTEARPAMGVGEEGARPAREARTAAGRTAAGRTADARIARAVHAAEKASEVAATSAAKAAGGGKPSKTKATVQTDDVPAAETAIAKGDAAAADGGVVAANDGADAPDVAESTANAETDAADATADAETAANDETT